MMGRRWKRYPKYKDSGVEWLGEIPEGWETKKVKYCFENLDSRRIPLSGEDRSYMEKNYPYYGASGVIDFVQDYLFNELLLLVSEDGANLLSRSTPLAFIVSGKYWVNNHAHILRIKLGDIGYFESLLQTFDFTPLITGAAQPKLTAERLSDVLLCVPPLPEQIAIATFLDCETARIDALIEKKQRQIELLQEKRAALISQAVTKGLDPTVPMKDSGVPWLGEVPEHWEIPKIKRVTRKIGSGKTPKGGSEIYQDTGVMFIRSQNVQFSGLNFNEIVYISHDIDNEMENTKVIEGDVLLNITGASIGRCCYCDDLMGCMANVNQHVCIIRSNSLKILPPFLNRLLSSSIGQSQIFSSEEGVSREGLNFSQISNMIITCPSLDEQTEIVDYLNHEIALIENIISKIISSTNSLNEYRSALISAAVTGKIDVRDTALTHPEAQS